MTAFQHTCILALNNLPVPRAHLCALEGVELDDLLHAASRVRQRYHHASVSCCAIINARSGRCTEDCSFCAQSSRHETSIARHPMLSVDKLVAAAKEAATLPIDHLGIVTSGRSIAGGQERSRLVNGIRAVRKAVEVPVHVSLGTLDDEALETMKDCGVSRVHHNLETSRRFFPSVCSTHSYDERLAMVRRATAAGFEVCSGGLFGMGETWEDRVDLALELGGLGVRSVPLNFLVPIKGTRLASQPLLPPREALRIVALFRLALPTVDIRVCGGRPVVLRDLQSWIFLAGATSMMIGNFLTTAGREVAQDLQMLDDLGLRAVTTKDHR